jgi:hypothetical protein
MYAALNSDPSDPDVIIKLDISNAFNVLCRQLTLDVLGGKASCDYACGLKEGDNIETVCEELRNMFQYFRAMRTTKSHLRYFDYLGNVLDAWGKTGGQQGDPLERESVLFIGTQFSILYTSMYSPAETATPRA